LFPNPPFTNQFVLLGTFSSNQIITSIFQCSDGTDTFTVSIEFNIIDSSICFLSDCDVLLSNLSYKNISEITLEDEVVGYLSKTPQKIKEI